MWWSAFIWQVLSPRVSPMLRWTPMPSYRCGVPERCHKDRVLLHMHARGSVVWVDTHGSKGCWAHRKDDRSSSPAVRLPACAQHKYPAQIEDIEKAYHWLLEQGIRPQEHRQHRSLHWRKPCCEPSGY